MMFPKLYAIADHSCFADASAIYAFASELLEGGVTLIQYRNKQENARQMLQEARELRRIVGDRARLIMNDRADLAVAAGFDGVHVGQQDLSAEAARAVIGPHLWLGVSTHNAEQVVLADKTGANYIAIGPVFATGSKKNPDPIVGLDGVHRARLLTRKPLVAIGGISCEIAPEVIAAGADSVAVISALVKEPRRAAEEFLKCLG
jgi:thiamine-phosphate pyrophosphorylase